MRYLGAGIAQLFEVLSREGRRLPVMAGIVEPAIPSQKYDQDGLPSLLARFGTPAPSAPTLEDVTHATGTQHDMHAQPTLDEQRGASDEPDPWAHATTVLIRNISYFMTRKSFIEVLETLGFRGQFDFVSLPVCAYRANRAYAYLHTDIEVQL